jgi:hypothetical protein
VYQFDAEARAFVPISKKIRDIRQLMQMNKPQLKGLFGIKGGLGVWVEHS